MAAPKLRFKEFDGNWDIYALEDQIDFLAGYAFDSKLMSNDIQKYQLIKMSNVYQNQLDLTRNSSYWEKIDKKTEKFLLKKGDIVLTLTGTVGKTDYGYNVEIKENDKFLLNQRLVRLRGKIDFSLSKFVQYRISTDKFFYHFFNSSKGGTGNQSNVSIEDLKLLELSFPSKAEQTKIATFLSAVDEKISQLSQKLQLLSQYKQGMMQKLFSQQIRFKADDGSEFGEWEEIALGEIKGISIVSGKSSHEKLESAKYYYYGSTGVIGYSNEYDYQGTKILIARVGHNAGYIYMVSGQYNVSDNTLILELPSNLNHIFIRAFLEKIQLNKLVFGTGQPLITGGLLKKVIIQVPSLEEQTKIANFLSAIDQKIEVVGQEIEQAKQWKKGLLQQMFV